MHLESIRTMVKYQDMPRYSHCFKIRRLEIASLRSQWQNRLAMTKNGAFRLFTRISLFGKSLCAEFVELLFIVRIPCLDIKSEGMPNIMKPSSLWPSDAYTFRCYNNQVPTNVFSFDTFVEFLEYFKCFSHRPFVFRFIKPRYIESVYKCLFVVIPDLIRYPESIENTGFRLKNCRNDRMFLRFDKLGI
jgi:hypothetical protein